MSVYGHKRKRSLRDSTIDLSKMRMISNCLDALKKELDGIEETEGELRTISDHVFALESILKGAQKPKVTFLTVAAEDLKKAGVMRKRLIFDPAKVSQLAEVLTTDAQARISDLYCRINKIYAHVNTDYEAGARMILNAILLALAEITSDKHTKVAILPGMRIAQGDGIQIANRNSGYELRLSGTVDYAVIKYEDVRDYKDRLLAPGGSRDDVFDIAKGRLFLVEAKRQSLSEGLVTYIPEAVSQAIALLKSVNVPEVRFCLSDGQTWIFFILKSENETLVYYESAIRRLSREALENTDAPLRQIMQLVREWLTPTTTGLFELE